MKTEVIRKVDELGRIIIPIEIRNTLCWESGTKILISLQGEHLVLKTFQGNCFICGSNENLQQFHGKQICQKCINEINQ